jgi:hypothetical protein
VLGENLTTIAKAYGVSLEALVEENGIEDPNLIVENQALCIPEADHNSYGEQGNGQSYRESYGSSNGESNGQNNGQSNEPYMVPGVGYDPSTFNKEGGQEYGNSGSEYGNQERSNQQYGNQEYSNQGYGEQESDVYHVPGKGYDPNESYQPQYEPQYNSPERDSFDFDDTETPSDPGDEPEVPMDPIPDTEPGGNGGG